MSNRHIAPGRPPSDNRLNAAMLPRELVSYRRTAEFTEATIPPGLRRAHTTKAGAWGLLHVLEGRLAYRIADPRRTPSETILTAGGEPGVVEPTILHEVEPLGPVRFYVEFLRAPDADG